MTDNERRLPSWFELVRIFPISVWTITMVGIGFAAGIYCGCGTIIGG